MSRPGSSSSPRPAPRSSAPGPARRRRLPAASAAQARCSAAAGSAAARDRGRRVSETSPPRDANRLPLMVLSRVSKIYGAGEIAVHALRNVDFRLERGDYLAIIGASGSGKSTLMNIIGCLDMPTQGPLPARARRRQRPRRLRAGVDPQPQDRARLPELQPDPADDRSPQRRAAADLRARAPAERRRRALEAIEAVGLGKPRARTSRRSSRAASSSAPRSRARSSPIRRSSSPTSRPGTSTRRRPARCCRSSAA